jgi:hypothetical protein
VNDKASAVSSAPNEDPFARRAPPPLPPEAPPTRDEVRAIVRDAVLDATVPILQRLRALEEELRVRGGALLHAQAAPMARGSFVDGVAVVLPPAAPAVTSTTSFDANLVDDRELARAFNGGRRRKQMAWMLGLVALLAVASAVIGAIASNMR